MKSQGNVIKSVLLALALGSMPALAMEMGREKWFMEAAQKGDLEVVQWFIQKGVNLYARDQAGWSALIWAAHKGHKEVVRCLIQEGIDPNTKDDYGVTALMMAAGSDHKEVVECLIQAGADINAKAEDNWTALRFAVTNKYQSMCELLIETMLGRRLWRTNQSNAALFCMKNIEDNGKIFIDIIEPVGQRLSATQYLGYEKTLEDVKKAENNEIKRALLAKYFPNEVKKN